MDACSCVYPCVRTTASLTGSAAALALGKQGRQLAAGIADLQSIGKNYLCLSHREPPDFPRSVAELCADETIVKRVFPTGYHSGAGEASGLCPAVGARRPPPRRVAPRSPAGAGSPRGGRVPGARKRAEGAGRVVAPRAPSRVPRARAQLARSALVQRSPAPRALGFTFRGAGVRALLPGLRLPCKVGAAVGRGGGGGAGTRPRRVGDPACAAGWGAGRGSGARGGPPPRW